MYRLLQLALSVAIGTWRRADDGRSDDRDYLDGIRYRRYSRSVLLERRRLLGLAAACGDDDWLGTAPSGEDVATVSSRLDLRSPVTLQRLGAAIEDYQAWRSRYASREAPA